MLSVKVLKTCNGRQCIIVAFKVPLYEICVILGNAEETNCKYLLWRIYPSFSLNDYTPNRIHGGLPCRHC